MKRILLALALTACADTAAPDVTPPNICYAAIAGQDQNGQIIVWIREFDPCPTDAELEATGWMKVPKPDWWPE